MPGAWRRRARAPREVSWSRLEDQHADLLPSVQAVWELAQRTSEFPPLGCRGLNRRSIKGCVPGAWAKPQYKPWDGIGALPMPDRGPPQHFCVSLWGKLSFEMVEQLSWVIKCRSPGVFRGRRGAIGVYQKEST